MDPKILRAPFVIFVCFVFQPLSAEAVDPRGVESIDRLQKKIHVKRNE